MPSSIERRVASRFRFLARILRVGIWPGCVLSDASVLLIDRKRLWRLDIDSGTLSIEHHIQRGSKPLSISRVDTVPGFSGTVCCYGEYWGNEGRDAVRVWGRDFSGAWRVLYTFPKGSIDHIHSIFPDIERNCVWILTGDFDKSAGLWMATDNFKTVIPVLVGDQKYRCAWLHFSGNEVLYATDSQLERNSLRQLFEADGMFSSNFLADLPGSSIYSCLVGDRLIFSTTVEPGMRSDNFIRDMLDREPGPGISDNSAHLFSWDPANGLKEIGDWQKDWLPFRPFQFGSVSFPVGLNPRSDRLYAYTTALTDLDDCCLVLDL